MHRFTSRKVKKKCESFWYAAKAQQIHSNLSSSSFLHENYTYQFSSSKCPQINNFGHHQTKNFHEYILNLHPLCKPQRLTKIRTYKLEIGILWIESIAFSRTWWQWTFQRPMVICVKVHFCALEKFFFKLATIKIRSFSKLVEATSPFSMLIHLST
jgi:hypothetical protein